MRLDIPRVGRVWLDLLAQIGDLQTQEVGIATGAFAPDPGQKLLVEEEPPRVAGEQRQEAVFGWCEIDGDPGEADHVLAEIDG